MQNCVKVAIPDSIYAVCRPMVLRSAHKLGLAGNVAVIRESAAIAINYNVKLHRESQAQFMAINLDTECSTISCWKSVDQFKMKQLTDPVVLRNVSLTKMVDDVLSVITDIVGDDVVGADPRKLEELRLNTMSALNRENVVFEKAADLVLDPVFKALGRLLAMKQTEGSKQHVIISGQLADIEWVQKAIRRRFGENATLKVEAESIHFAKSKRAKGAALFGIVSAPKGQLVSYRANKSWGISVQRDFEADRDEQSRRMSGDVVNGVFHEIIGKGERVRANHCEVVWVRPISKSKMQIDVYCHSAGREEEQETVYVEQCEFEGSETFELLKEWKEQSAIPVVFWCDVEENNKIRLHVSVNNLADAQSRIFDLTWNNVK